MFSSSLVNFAVHWPYREGCWLDELFSIDNILPVTISDIFNFLTNIFLGALSFTQIFRITSLFSPGPDQEVSPWVADRNHPKSIPQFQKFNSRTLPTPQPSPPTMLFSSLPDICSILPLLKGELTGSTLTHWEYYSRQCFGYCKFWTNIFVGGLSFTQIFRITSSFLLVQIKRSVFGWLIEIIPNHYSNTRSPTATLYPPLNIPLQPCSPPHSLRFAVIATPQRVVGWIDSFSLRLILRAIFWIF